MKTLLKVIVALLCIAGLYYGYQEFNQRRLASWREQMGQAIAANERDIAPRISKYLTTYVLDSNQRVELGFSGFLGDFTPSGGWIIRSHGTTSDRFGGKLDLDLLTFFDKDGQLASFTINLRSPDRHRAPHTWETVRSWGVRQELKSLLVHNGKLSMGPATQVGHSFVGLMADGKSLSLQVLGDGEQHIRDLLNSTSEKTGG